MMHEEHFELCTELFPVYTQKQKVRPKQLPFPASLLEGKSDDVIVSDINVSGKLSFSFQFRNECQMILPIDSGVFSKLQSGRVRKSRGGS